MADVYPTLLSSVASRLVLQATCIALTLLLLEVHSIGGQITPTVKSPELNPHSTHSTHSTSLLVVVLDGFRWDYGHDSPGLKAFWQNGSHSDYLVPVFPSLTYPSLYSIFTGLYPENNGIVNDVMYDPDTRGNFYRQNDPEFLKSSWWNASEPIWTTAKKSGKKVAIYSLPMCSVRLQGLVPDVCEKHSDVSTSALASDLEKAFHNLARDTTDFALVYFDHLHELGRTFGPDSPEVSLEVADIDRCIAKLMDLITSVGMQDKLNVIITSTHGMAVVDKSPKRHIQLDKVSMNSTEPGVNLDDLEFILSYGVFVGVYPKMDKINKVFEDLKRVDGVDVYKRKDIPEDLHIKWNNRTAPIVVIAHKGHYIDKATSTQIQIPRQQIETIVNGVSGYNPKDVHEMRGIFYATGPGFKAKSVESVSALDIYNMMTCLLNVTGHPSNSSAVTVCNLLKIDCPLVCGDDGSGRSSATKCGQQMFTDRLWILGLIFIISAYSSQLISPPI